MRCRHYWILIGILFVTGLAAAEARAADEVRYGTLLQPAGEVKLLRPTRSSTAPTNTLTITVTNTTTILPGDIVETGANGKAVIELWNGKIVTLGYLTRFQLYSPDRSGVFMRLLSGVLQYFSRDESPEPWVWTKYAVGGPTGTEFLMIAADDRTIMSVSQGTAVLTNDLGVLPLRTNQFGEARAGREPRILLDATNIVQWWLYYPAVLNVEEIEFSASERQALAASLAAYRSGDLRSALAAYPGYPDPAEPATDASRIYLAGLWLAAGQVDKTTDLARKVSADSSLRAALFWVIDATQGNLTNAPVPHTTSSEWLGLSYYFQALHRLGDALTAARKAQAGQRDFAFALEREAELQFSFGRIVEAETVLKRSLDLAPSNVQAHALKGFLRAARGDLAGATEEFETALALDSTYGNAWLGRGLVRIRRGDAAGGRKDLEAAAALEPERSLLRSYLGKAYADAAEYRKATNELQRARDLDAPDPTPWLYSALLKRDQNQINAAVADLEQSIALNTNRAVYRSGFLLDEDLAVRSSSLAELYRAAGMREVSLREAARAVSSDYGNYSAHQFLSESFDVVRDPTRFNLRNETVWFNELLLANLLSPVGGTPLSQHISQQEYVRLFERDHIGLRSSTEYRSDGQVLELASQYGNQGRTGWSLDLDYQHNDGVRVNNQLDRIEWYSTLKQQVTPQDSALLMAKYQDYHSGDNFQYYDPAQAVQPFYQFDEFQTPILVGGWHHEWHPGAHTLVFGGLLQNDQQFTNRGVNELVLPNSLVPFDVHFRSRLHIGSVEAQQILETGAQTLVVGGRWQGGTFDSENQLIDSAFNLLSEEASITEDFERWTGYAYETVRLFDQLDLTAGFAAEHLRYPVNFRSVPIQSGEATRARLDPKLAGVWQVSSNAVLRGVWARSLGGVSLDESFRLEPTQLAGFSQAFRTLISESLVGPVSAPVHEVTGMALDIKLPTRTYIGLWGEIVGAEVSQTAGAFVLNTGLSAVGISQRLQYDEQSIHASINQLWSDEWSVGLNYSFTHSLLDLSYPGPAGSSLNGDRLHANLHEIHLFALYNHPCGFFAQLGWNGYLQTESRALITLNPFGSQDVPDSTFNQLDVVCGYRFGRHGEVAVGLLNLLGGDYKLNPVTPYREMPRERVFWTRLQFRF